MQSVSAGEPCTIPSLINYTKQRRPFAHSVSVAPVSSSDGSITLFRATSRAVGPIHSRCCSVDLRDHEVDLDGEGFDPVDTTASALQVLASPHLGSSVLAGSIPSWIPRSPASSGLPAPPSPSSRFVVLTQSSPPYGILWASHGWLSLCGFTSSDVLGRDLKLIQGPGTDKNAIIKMMASIRRCEAVSVELVNYDREKRPFKHTVSVSKVAGSMTEPPMLRAVSTNVVKACSRGGFKEYVPPPEGNRANSPRSSPTQKASSPLRKASSPSSASAGWKAPPPFSLGAASLGAASLGAAGWGEPRSRSPSPPKAGLGRQPMGLRPMLEEEEPCAAEAVSAAWAPSSWSSFWAEAPRSSMSRGVAAGAGDARARR